MVALFRSSTSLDPSKKAEDVLEYVLNETKDEASEVDATASTTKVELSKESVLTAVSDRAKSRVLFITEDISILKEGSLLQSHFKNIAQGFEEVHVVVLTTVYQAKKGVIRLDTNLWVYSTSVRYSWAQVFAVLKIAETELQFASGFRPDVVVALEPCTSGFIGMEVAEKYGRAFQVHVRDDYFSEFYKQTHSKLSLFLAKFTLKRALSIRTSSETIREKLSKMYTHTKDISVLPKFSNLESLVATATQGGVVEDCFPQFTFVMLYVGALDHESNLFRAIDAARSALFSKGVGLVVLGDGPAKGEFEKRAQILGVGEQVIFTKDMTKLGLYLQNADILLCTDTTDASDELIVQAAASGLPLLAAENHFRSDLFVDGTDAFLCPKEDTVCFSQKLIKFLNTNALRTQFSENAKAIVTTRLSEDPAVYREAYRNSIEGVFDSVPLQ